MWSIVERRQRRRFVSADANFAGLLGKINKFASDDSALSVILPYLDRPVQQFFSLVMKEIFGHLFGRKIYCAKKVFLSVFGKGSNIIRTMVSTGVIVVALNHAIQRRKNGRCNVYTNQGRRNKLIVRNINNLFRSSSLPDDGLFFYLTNTGLDT